MGIAEVMGIVVFGGVFPIRDCVPFLMGFVVVLILWEGSLGLVIFSQACRESL